MSASGIIWTQNTRKLYGYGRGRAYSSVEFVACPVCHMPPGVLCRGANGEPHLDRHYKRCDRYREWSMSPKRRDPRCGMRGCRDYATRILMSPGGEIQLLCCRSCVLSTVPGTTITRPFSASGQSR